MSAPTPHQAEVLRTLVRFSVRPSRKDVLSATTGDCSEVPQSDVGSTGALYHLQVKGYAKITKIEVGPRGGRYPFWMPTQLGLEHVQRYIRRSIITKETTNV